jgi:hypothetical protein
MSDTIKFNNMPEGLDAELIRKRDALIVEGKQEFRSILREVDLTKHEEERKVKAILAAKKGAYSRKFHQFAKELYIVDLFTRNNIAMTFKNFNVISQKIFGESLDKSVIAKMEKDTKYGKGVQSDIVIENEVQVIEKLKLAITFMVKPYRVQVLEHLAYDKIDVDYEPAGNDKIKNKRAKI